MRRSEVVRKRMVKALRDGAIDSMVIESIIDVVRRIPVVAKHERAKAALIKGLLDIEKQADKAEKVRDRRLGKAANALERLSIGQSLMPEHWTTEAMSRDAPTDTES